MRTSRSCCWTGPASGSTPSWWRWGSTRREGSTCWESWRVPPRTKRSAAGCCRTWWTGACRWSERRNVVEHLPQGKRAWAKAAMRKAYDSEMPAQAKRRLLELARNLEAHDGAAASIREGLEETLTLLSLGITGALARTLSTTNPIENLQGTLKRVSRNVTRWRSGGMALRWAVTGLLEAQKSFRRLKGYRELPALLRALDARIGSHENHRTVVEDVA